MRRVALLAVLVAASAVASSTTAGARTLFGRRVAERHALSPDEIARRRDAFAANLAARGLVRDGDRILPGAAPLVAATTLQHAGWEEPPHYATIFLEFAGGTVSSGTNAALKQSVCVGAVDVDLPGYAGDEAEAMSIIQVFEHAMAPYAVRIVHGDPPPSHLPYSMVMLGGDPTDLGLDAGILGVSCSTDCGDVWWRDTTFAFTEASSDALTLGNTALQEAAHAFGLDHIDGGEHIMYPFGTSGERVWATECTPYNDATGGIGCGYVHDVFCGEDAGMQNDHAELLAYFGPNEPDVVAPVVELLQPDDGLHLDVGDGLTVEATVTDDHEGVGWRLRVQPDGGAVQISDAYTFATSWTLADLPDGTYTIAVEAIDHDGNVGSDSVVVVVGTGAPQSSDETGSSSGGTTAADSSSGGGTTASSDGADGCACGLDAHRSAPVGLVVLVAAARRRRA